MGARIQFRRGKKAFWESENPILRPGEPGFESDTRKLKIGDGETPWNDLPYSPTTLDTPDDVEVPLDLASHVNDPTPHPVYDNGASLTLLYQNAKV